MPSNPVDDSTNANSSTIDGPVFQATWLNPIVPAGLGRSELADQGKRRRYIGAHGDADDEGVDVEHRLVFANAIIKMPQA